jgi:PAS domain S-box-containing protein
MVAEMADGGTHPGFGGRVGGAAQDRLLASLVESVTDYAIFALDVDGCVQTWNAGAERLKGYRPDEIVGQHFSAFYGQDDLDAKKPDWELAVAAADGSFEDEGWRVRKDGSLFWADVVITAIREADGQLIGFGQVTRDLTERKRAEDALRESEERFALLVSSVADYAIFLLRTDGTVATWNLGAERLKGYRPDEIIGRHFSTFYGDDDRRAGLPDHALATALEAGRWHDEGWRYRRDGSRFWADVVITSLHAADGSHRGFAKVTRDLTERKRADDALRGVLDRERESADRLRELDRLKSDFIAVVAHDLRTPLGVVRSLLEITADEWPTMGDDERRATVDRARGRLERLGEFVDDLFDAVRLDTGDLQISPEPVDVRGLVDQVVTDALVTEPDRRIIVDGVAEAIALADPQRTWQILDNLVSNALKFSPADSTVRVHLRADVARVDVDVIDQGPGVPVEQRDVLFGRFARLPASATTPGAGLGLFIARSLAEAQGGALALAEPSPEGGATFTLCLPAVGAR